MNGIIEKFQSDYPTKADKEKALKSMTNAQIDELIKASGNVQAKIFYSSFKKKESDISEKRYNDVHDPKTGRFGTKNGGSSKVSDSNSKKSGRKYGETDTADALTEINSGKHNSLEKHMDKNGKLTEERELLHKDIIDKKLEGKIPVDGQATMTMLGGGPASGKSSVMNPDTSKNPHAITVDPDDMKKQLPGFNEMAEKSSNAASYYHEESSALAKRYSQVAYKENYDVVYDGTGDGSVKSVEKKIDAARANGYRVEAKYVTIDTDEAVRRNQKRFDDAKAEGKTPRLPPEKYVRDCHAKCTDISVATAPKFDHIEIWDNNGAKGQQVKIAEGGNGQYLKPVQGREREFRNYLAKGTRGVEGFETLPDGQVKPID